MGLGALDELGDAFDEARRVEDRQPACLLLISTALLVMWASPEPSVLYVLWAVLYVGETYRMSQIR